MEYDYDNLALDGRTREDGSECGFSGCRYSRPADRKDNFSHASPKLELQYQANPAWRWHLAVADSFRAPQATELYRLQRAQSVADLEEVSAKHIEVGGHWNTAASQLQFSLYRTRQRNVIIRDSDFFNVDGQKVNSTGVETSLRHAITANWSLRLAASYAEHKYASDQLLGETNIRGNLLDTAPKLVTNLALRWQATTRMSTELQLYKVSAYYLDAENLHEYPGHSIVNWRTSYQLNNNWSASLRVLNLTDRLYAERADFTSFTEQRYFPGEPRSVFAEIRWQQ